jgi:trimeric autotransporter adhesin
MSGSSSKPAVESRDSDNGSGCWRIPLSLRRSQWTGGGAVRRGVLASSMLLVTSLAISFGASLPTAAAGTPGAAGIAHASVTGTGAIPFGKLAPIAGGTSSSAFDGSSTQAQQPVGLAVEPPRSPNGEGVVIADEGSDLVRLLNAGAATEGVLAGDGVAGYNGDEYYGTERVATNAEILSPTAVAVDKEGDTFIAESHRIRFVPAFGTLCTSSCPYGLPSETGGDIYTIAGSTSAGYDGDGGLAVDAELNSPGGVAIAPDGDLLIADTYNNRIRLVAFASCSSGCPYGLTSETEGDIYTIAGNGTPGTGGKGAPATGAVVSLPTSIAVGPFGDLIIGNEGSNTVSLLAARTCSSDCPYNLATTAGEMYTLAGGNGAAGYSGDGGAATKALLDGPSDVAVDLQGDVLVADTLNDVVRMVADATCPSSCQFGLSSTTPGDIYTIAGDESLGYGYSGDGGPATSAQLDAPVGLAVDSAGNVLIADTANNRVRMIAAASCSTSCPYGLSATTAFDIYTVAGDGGTSGWGNGEPASAAELDAPNGVAVDAQDDVVISDLGNNLIRFVAGANCTSGCPYGLSSGGATTTAGDVYNVAGTGTAGYGGDGAPATAAEISDPGGVTLDSLGDIVFADMGNNRIRLVAAQSCPSACPYGLPSMTGGDIYTVAGDGTAGYSGDGALATNAELDVPGDVTLGPSGDLLIADSSNNRIRLVADVNCPRDCPYGLASTTIGDIYTVAGNGAYGYGGDGGAAKNAELAWPLGVSMAPSSDDVVISDTMNNRIRIVAEDSCSSNCPYGLAPVVAGDVYTVAGDGDFGNTSDLGPGPNGSLAMPIGVTVDSAGNIFVADSNNDEVREISNQNCDYYCPYGVSDAPLGSIATVAGTGTYGGSPNASPSLNMQLSDPVGVAAYPGGGVVISESGQGAVQVLTSVPASYVGPPPPTLKQGFWLACADGYVASVGAAPTFPPEITVPKTNPVVGIASTADGEGYWLVTANGSVYSFGDARYHGSLPGLHINVDDIVAIAPTGDGGGYWMIGRDGGEFAFGDAKYHGSLPGLGIHVDDIVGMVATSNSGGYWIVGSDGGVFAFGNTHYVGSLPGLHIDVNDIRAMIPSPTREGYVLVGSDGGAFVFGGGVHYYGSLPGRHIVVSDIVGLALTPDTLGYWFAGAGAGTFAFGDAKVLTPPVAVKDHLPVVAIAAS